MSPPRPRRNHLDRRALVDPGRDDPAAQGVFREDHPFAPVLGYEGTRHATAAILIDPADLLIVLGSGFYAGGHQLSPFFSALMRGRRDG